jgi:hypothetical protein
MAGVTTFSRNGEPIAPKLGSRQPTQHASGDFRALLAREGMSREGDGWDNAVVGSLFATLKCESVEDAEWATREEARLALFDR